MTSIYSLTFPVRVIRIGLRQTQGGYIVAVPDRRGSHDGYHFLCVPVPNSSPPAPVQASVAEQPQVVHAGVPTLEEVAFWREAAAAVDKRGDLMPEHGGIGFQAVQQAGEGAMGRGGGGWSASPLYR